jgi:hypothetical protein
MSLVKFRDALVAEIPDVDTSNKVFKFLQDYIENDIKLYKSNKKDNKLTFGKFAGYTIKEVASGGDKGKSYLEWLMAQSWFTEEKFPNEYEELKRLKIKKKPRATFD